MIFVSGGITCGDIIRERKRQIFYKEQIAYFMCSLARVKLVHPRERGRVLACGRDGAVCLLADELIFNFK
ncbi:MAG: hypothetical protein D6719_11815 [Candidatus Dadabacteria bacterium]|nr:MAG: hypothetical protein D6719_11815 [Candidatus Dadabacteria bacterium]